jgi:hypothetical protein
MLPKYFPSRWDPDAKIQMPCDVELTAPPP